LRKNDEAQLSENPNSNDDQNVVTMRTIHGIVKINLFYDKAPNTSKRFAQLVKAGFYDGLSFHRVVPNFIIQSGDPTGSGPGGSGQKIKGEDSYEKHIKGTVGMARLENDPDSGDSQFYISLSTMPELDGKFTVFGQVQDGLEVLDKISLGDKIITMTLGETSEGAALELTPTPLPTATASATPTPVK